MNITFICPILSDKRDEYFIATGEAFKPLNEWEVDVSKWTVEQRKDLLRLVKLIHGNSMSVQNVHTVDLAITHHIPMASAKRFYAPPPKNAESIPDAIADLLSQYDEWRASRLEKATLPQPKPNLTDKLKGWLGLDLHSPD